MSDSEAEFSRLSNVIDAYQMDIKMPTPEWLPIPFRAQAALTPYGAHQKEPHELMGSIFLLEPVRDSSREVELNRLYVMSAPGEYHVIFSTQLPQREPVFHRIVVMSNQLKITVLPEK